MNSPLSLAAVGVVGSVLVGLLTLAGVRIQARNQQKSTEANVGLEALVAALAEHRAIATDAKADAAAARANSEEAVQEAKSARYEATVAREQNERLEADVLGLVDYLRLIWDGVLAGTVPPAPPIPARLRHLLSPSDFTTPTAEKD
ncbi:hypothetical protein [Phycicoccus avicenniae]|uniref:hypothetical protein n=1 Tax=Phycicoccus avicenniae TaxID=2828860 RepID=UPI003D2A44FB